MGGGLIIALAIEDWNIHKRIALKVLSISGAKPTSLMAGFMIITGFLSMWISNTATTALMIPIVNAVHAQLFPRETKEKEEEERKLGLKRNELEDEQRAAAENSNQQHKLLPGPDSPKQDIKCSDRDLSNSNNIKQQNSNNNNSKYITTNSTDFNSSLQNSSNQ